MATPSHYVTLGKDTITEQTDAAPGELNQPVDVPALQQARCGGCGQALPLDFVPPQDEPWSSGIFGCRQDKKNCWEGALCPCVLFGKNVEAIKDDINWKAACMCHAVFVEGGIGAAVFLAVWPAVVDPGTLCLLGETLLLAWWMCAMYTGLFRQELQRKYHLQNAPCDPCCVHCLLHPCALCQEHREMQHRLSADDPSAALALNPPVHQEMSVSHKASDEPVELEL